MTNPCIVTAPDDFCRLTRCGLELAYLCLAWFVAVLWEPAGLAGTSIFLLVGPAGYCVVMGLAEFALNRPSLREPNKQDSTSGRIGKMLWPYVIRSLGWTAFALSSLLTYVSAGPAWMALPAVLGGFVYFIVRFRSADKNLSGGVRPMEDQAVLADVEGLAGSAGIGVAKVCLAGVDGSVAEIFSARGGCVLHLDPTAVSLLDRRQLRAIIAHELAHVKLGHHRLRRIISLAGLGGIAVLWFLVLKVRSGQLILPAGAAYMVVLMLLAGRIASLLAGPAVLAVIRNQELRANDIAVELTGDPQGFISAVERLNQAGGVHARPSRLFTHLAGASPPAWVMIERVQRKARSLQGGRDEK